MMVRAALLRAGAPVAFLDQRAVLDTEIELVADTTVEGHLRVDDQLLPFGDICAAYLRPYDSFRIPEIAKAGAGSAAWIHAAAVEDLLFSWAEITDAFVVNRPSAMAVNTSKPYQAAQIRALGFATPDTLITTDEQAVLDFREKHPQIIYKSISATRSIVSRLSEDQLGRLDDVAWCPTQFQEFIAGTEYRVHVVGEEVFVCEIQSSADDYRYASMHDATTAVRRCELPVDCTELCVEMASAMQLSVAGIDLRRTPSGKWYCLEVNPAPGFSFYQQATGLPIDEAVARLLLAMSR